MKTFLIVLAALSSACGAGAGPGESKALRSGEVQLTAAAGTNYNCNTNTLPATCGVSLQDLPCCAIFTSEGEEQMNCCPSAGLFNHRLCSSDGARPTCPSGGTYPGCANVICPPLTWPCPDLGGCCNRCGLIGPRGCSICDQAAFQGGACSIARTAPAGVCVEKFEAQGQSRCLTVPGAASLPAISVAGANPLVLECASGAYQDPGATAADPCDGDLTAALVTTSSVDTGAVGTYTVSYSVTSPGGSTGTASRTVIVRDTTPPAVEVAAPIVLWPPDHKLHAFTLADCASATDACAGPIDVNQSGVIVSASSGVVVTAPSAFAVPAEREGRSHGWLAEIDFTVTDASGNTSLATCRFSVPHDQSGN